MGKWQQHTKSKPKEPKVICGKYYTEINIPCSWVFEGYCGSDGKPCKILVV